MNGTKIAQIGQSYKASLFSGSGFSKTSLVLSNDSLSGVGKTYTASSRAIVSFTARLESVSSIGMKYYSNYLLLVLGILTLIVYGLGILFIIFYFTSKQRFFVVNVSGALYALSLRGISNQDLDVFVEKVAEHSRTRFPSEAISSSS